jgi:hypothetical protein
MPIKYLNNMITIIGIKRPNKTENIVISFLNILLKKIEAQSAALRAKYFFNNVLPTRKKRSKKR